MPAEQPAATSAQSSAEMLRELWNSTAASSSWRCTGGSASSSRGARKWSAGSR